MKYQVRFTAQFKRDLKLAEKQHRDLSRLYAVISVLAEGETLDPVYRDHGLIGRYTGVRDCHIERDWLLIYEIIEERSVLVLHRLGTHSELFRS